MASWRTGQAQSPVDGWSSPHREREREVKRVETPQIQSEKQQPALVVVGQSFDF